MDWYFGSDIEDFAVPKSEEMFDSLPSPDSWPSWVNTIGNFNSPKKFNILGVEEHLLIDTMFSSAVEQLSPPSICQNSRHTFHQHCACPHEYSDVQLGDLPIIDEADDIFFQSLFEVDAGALEGGDSSAYFTQTSSKDDMLAVVDSLGRRNHIQESTNNVENPGYFLPEKESESEACVLEEQPNMCKDIIKEDMSKEGAVLLKLQSLTVQLARKTRICFRDSLYRLAEHSRYQNKCGHNGKEDMKNCKPTSRVGPSRFRESKAKNSDTNAIDRTVAMLLFDSMKACYPAAASTSSYDSETLQREYQANSHFYRPSFSVSSLCTVPGGDAEVPVFGLTNQPLPSRILL